MQAFGTGFILSFSAVLSICLLTPYIRTDRLAALRTRKGGVKYVGAPRAAAGTLNASLAVCAGCFPVQAAFFYEFSTVSVLSNVLCSPLVVCTLASGAVTAISGLAADVLAVVPALFALNFIWLIERVAELAAAIPFSILRTGGLGPFFFAVYYSCLAGCVYVVKWRGPRAEDGKGRITCIKYKRPALAFLSMSLIFFIISSIPFSPFFTGARPGEMEAVFLDVGNSNAAYINIGGRYHVIVDAGGPSGYAVNKGTDGNVGGTAAAGGVGGMAVENRLRDYLTGRGVGAVDLAVATHGDSDHIQGFWSIFDAIPVRRLMIPYNADGRLVELAGYAEGLGTQVVKCGAGDTVLLGETTVINTLWPAYGDTVSETEEAAPSNDACLVTLFSNGGSKALFCGDIGRDEEYLIMRYAGEGALDADIMSVPHHGSKYSSGDDFLRAVSPAAAIAGVGRNLYGHPSPEAMERYAGVGAEFLRTDRDGMVTVRFAADGSFQIKRYADAANAYAWQKGLN